MLSTPCLDCGEPTKAGTRCPDCATRFNRLKPARDAPRKDRKAAPEKRGYDPAWRRLSLKARRLQPFCTDCGTRDDLQADHTPEAWERKEHGLPIRLLDVDVVCGACNRKRGAARGQHARSHSKATRVAK